MKKITQPIVFICETQFLRAVGEAKIVSRTIPPQAEGLIPRPLGRNLGPGPALGFIPMILLCLGFNNLQAQQATVASGGDASGSGGSAAYSIGQPVYTNVSGSSGSSNQGVQQPYEFFSVGLEENENISLSMTVFPNPSSTQVSLSIEDQKIENMNYQLFDASGKLIQQEGLNSTMTVIPLQKLAPGNYILSIYEKNKTVKTFKIIKNN